MLVVASGPCGYFLVSYLLGTLGKCRGCDEEMQCCFSKCDHASESTATSDSNDGHYKSPPVVLSYGTEYGGPLLRTVH